MFCVVVQLVQAYFCNTCCKKGFIKVFKNVEWVGVCIPISLPPSLWRRHLVQYSDYTLYCIVQVASCRPVTASTEQPQPAPRPCSIMRPRFMPQLVRSTVIIHGCAFACVRQSLSANDVHREAQLVSSLSNVSTSNPSNLPAACQSTSEQLNPALVHPSHIPSIRCFVLVSCRFTTSSQDPRTSAGHDSD